MDSVSLLTAGSSWTKLLAANSTQNGFGTVRSQLAKPAASATVGVVDLLGVNVNYAAVGQNALLLRVFGAGANNDTFNVRVWGWAQESSVKSWENCLLAQCSGAFGNLAGLAGCAITATDFEADTYALTYGSTLDVSVNSNAADVRGAYVRVDLMGFNVFQVEFDRNSSATSLNALWRSL